MGVEVKAMRALMVLLASLVAATATAHDFPDFEVLVPGPLELVLDGDPLVPLDRPGDDPMPVEGGPFMAEGLLRQRIEPPAEEGWPNIRVLSIIDPETGLSTDILRVPDWAESHDGEQHSCYPHNVYLDPCRGYIWLIIHCGSNTELWRLTVQPMCEQSDRWPWSRRMTR